MPVVKTAISMPEHLFLETNQEAEELNVSRSEVIVTALGEHFRRRKNQRLTEQINVAVDLAPETDEEVAWRKADEEEHWTTLEADPW
jgi:metal-responsive CopG/Arc/MetJ family transcriptional regulator